MRRLVLTGMTLAAAVAAAAPALAKPPLPPVPVGVSGNGNGGVCVAAFDWVPQCVDTGQVGTISATTAASPAGIFCPVFPNPIVQTVAHAVCTRSRV